MFYVDVHITDINDFNVMSLVWTRPKQLRTKQALHLISTAKPKPS